MTGHISRDMMTGHSDKPEHERDARGEAATERNRVGGRFPEKTGPSDQAEGSRETIEADLQSREAKPADQED